MDDTLQVDAPAHGVQHHLVGRKKVRAAHLLAVAAKSAAEGGGQLQHQHRQQLASVVVTLALRRPNLEFGLPGKYRET